MRSNRSLPRHRLEYGEARGQQGPIRFVAHEKRDRRMEQRVLIERARVDRMLAVAADDSTEYEAPARCAMVAYGVPATYGLRDRVSGFATEAHRARWEGEKWDETGS